MKAKQGFLFEGVGSDLCVFVGIDVVVTCDHDKCNAAQLALLQALLESKSGDVSIDDTVRDLNTPFVDGGKWVGPAINQLHSAGLIIPAIPRKSRRKPRKGGLVNVWRLVNRSKAIVAVRRLRIALERPQTKNGSEGAISEPS
tara:strand:- start:216030 stop:216458 length:429 start_codon:yes stop_codon:yes gene_type:complete